jgi:predicted ATP-grasp superfamily ATP-dependent carboligase
MPRVLLAGVSARAMAASAVRSGFDVAVLDAFGDLDLDPSVQFVPVAEGFSCAAAARASRALACDGVAYLAGFENHPEAVEQLAKGRALWGNAPGVLGRVRDPATVSRAFREQGHAAPEVRLRDPAPPGGRWLVKPLGRGGGHGIAFYAGRLPEGSYLQEFVDGVSGSVVFLADGNDSVVLGVSRQLIGDERFGATGFRYCGSILGAAPPESGAGELARSATRAFGLVGVNGIDFIVRDGEPWPVEINPRWTASVELAEQALGWPAFRAHHAACASGTLPGKDAVKPRPGALGKAILFARYAVRVGDTGDWPARGIRDVPRPGGTIPAGHPVCTVFAESPADEPCSRALGQAAARVYEEISAWGRI